MRENGSKTVCRVMEPITIQMEVYTKDPGKIISIQVLESMNLQMAQSMKANGKTTCSMELASSSTILVKNGKGSIDMANFKV